MEQTTVVEPTETEVEPIDRAEEASLLKKQYQMRQAQQLEKLSKARQARANRVEKEQSELEAIEASYDTLGGEWKQWLGVARTYEKKVPLQDRFDVRHNILLELHKARKRDGKPLPQLRAYRIASLVVSLYWRTLLRKPTVSLEAQSELDEQRLLDTVADERQIDVEAWLDAKMWLEHCPLRLIEIAYKKLNKQPLTKAEHCYLQRYRKKEQYSFVFGEQF